MRAATATLVPVERLQAAQALLVDTHRRETELAQTLQAREQALQTEINRFQHEFGQARGELQAYKNLRRRPS